MLADLLDNEGGLHGQLTSGHKHESLDLVFVGVNLLNDGDGVGSSLASAVLSSRNDVASLQCNGDGLLLNWLRIFESHLIDAQLQLLRYAE